jgi:hypothetical protein
MVDRGRCPRCRERVSPFAAGCAICGADLDIRRWDAAPGPLTRLSSRLAALGAGSGRTSLPAPVVVLVVLSAGTLLGGASLLIARLLGI